MKNTIWISLQLIYLTGMLTLYLLSIDKYSWMYEADPLLPTGSIESKASGSNIASSLILAALLAIQFVNFIFSTGRTSKILAVCLALLSVLFFACM